MEIIRYTVKHSVKLQLSILRLKGIRRHGTELGQIGSCHCCHVYPARNCKESQRVTNLALKAFGAVR